MNLIEDSRQKKGQHEVKNHYWSEHGHTIIRCKLPFGDYVQTPTISVDTKQNMLEIVGNLTTEHVRFREECKLARACGCKLVFLIENDENITCIADVERWKNPRRFTSPKAPAGMQIARAMRTMQERYGVEFQFCTPEEAGKRVIEILGGDQWNKT